jgi:uncharacterized membrane protein YdjX (TVP38/TMEM64 family)
MNKFLAFLNNMDARAWRTVWVSLALLGGVGVLVALGKTDLLGFTDVLEKWLEGLRNSPWALPAVVAVFVAAGFVGGPLILLNGVCVLAFGPWQGSVYAMVATIASGWLQFYLGRWGKTGILKRYGGNTVNRLSRFIGRNDFLASMIVRNVPVAPAIVINMAFGASHAKFWRFLAGMILGSIPKIAIVALLGQSVDSALGGGVLMGLGAAVAVIVIWIMVTLAARKAVHEDDDKGDGQTANARVQESAD